MSDHNSSGVPYQLLVNEDQLEAGDRIYGPRQHSPGIMSRLGHCFTEAARYGSAIEWRANLSQATIAVQNALKSEMAGLLYGRGLDTARNSAIWVLLTEASGLLERYDCRENGRYFHDIALTGSFAILLLEALALPLAFSAYTKYTGQDTLGGTGATRVRLIYNNIRERLKTFEYFSKIAAVAAGSPAGPMTLAVLAIIAFLPMIFELLGWSLDQCGLYEKYFDHRYWHKIEAIWKDCVATVGVMTALTVFTSVILAAIDAGRTTNIAMKWIYLMVSAVLGMVLGAITSISNSQWLSREFVYEKLVGSLDMFNFIFMMTASSLACQYPQLENPHQVKHQGGWGAYLFSGILAASGSVMSWFYSPEKDLTGKVYQRVEAPVEDGESFWARVAKMMANAMAPYKTTKLTSDGPDIQLREIETRK